MSPPLIRVVGYRLNAMSMYGGTVVKCRNNLISRRVLMRAGPLIDRIFWYGGFPTHRGFRSPQPFSDRHGQSACSAYTHSPTPEEEMAVTESGNTTLVGLILMCSFPYSTQLIKVC